MDDLEIAAVTAALEDPEEFEERKYLANHILGRRLSSGKPLDLAFARMIYYAATHKDNSDSLAVNSPQTRRFILEMTEDVAREGNLHVALTWFKSFRERSLGIGMPFTWKVFQALMHALSRKATLSWDVVKEDVSEYLNDLGSRLRAFLSQKELVPIWQPPAGWEHVVVGNTVVDIAQHLRSLGIPVLVLSSTRRGTPDLLLYMLGNYGSVDKERLDKRIRELIDLSTNVTVVNTSGSGKTRLLLEVLCRDWGFYIVCIWDAATSPYGSSDIYKFTDRSYLMDRRTPTGARFVPKPSTTADFTNNVSIAHQTVDTVLLARLLIFELFLDICDQLHSSWAQPGLYEDYAARSKRAWVLLQAFPRLSTTGVLCGEDPLSPSGESLQTRDIFLQLSERVQNLSMTDRKAQLQRLRSAIGKRGALPRYLVFDEVQVAATTLKSAFPTSGGKAGRPILKPIVTSICNWFEDARLLVAGTHLYKGDVELALISKSLKSGIENETYSELGGYFRDADIIAVLKHFFTPPFVDSWDPALTREILFWFRGRHRFLTYFIQVALSEGPDEGALRNVIANIRYYAAGSPLPPDPGFRDLGLHIRSLIPVSFPLKDNTPERPKNTNPWNESVEVRRARYAILSFLTTFTYPEFKDKETIKLVELGIGRFLDKEDGPIRISERLVLAALVNYFNDPRNPVDIRTMARYWLGKREGMPQVAGHGFELALVHIFWDIFSAPGGVLLSDVFCFETTVKDDSGKTRSTSRPRSAIKLDYTPEWASYKAHLIGDFAFERPGGPRIVARGASSSPLARRSRSAEDTLDWFQDMRRSDGQEKGMPPFLLPDKYHGPDIIFGLLLVHPTDPNAPKHPLLALISGKNWTTDDKPDGTLGERGGPEVRKAIFTMSPEGLFSTMQGKDKKAKQKAMREILSAFPPIPGNVTPKTPEELAVLVAAAHGEYDADEHEAMASKGKEKKRARKAKKGADEPIQPAESSKKGAQKKVVHPYGTNVEFGVLRCLASFPSTVTLPDMTTDEGFYPFATLTEDCLKVGANLGFDAFSEALLRVAPQPAHMKEEDVEDRNDKRRAYGPEASRPLPAPQGSAAARPLDEQEIIEEYFADGPNHAADARASQEVKGQGGDEGDGEEGGQGGDGDEDEEEPVDQYPGDDMSVDVPDDGDGEDAMSIYASDGPSASSRKRQGSPVDEAARPPKRRSARR